MSMRQAERHQRRVFDLRCTAPMVLECQRHGGYVIWLSGSPGAGWCYVVTPAPGFDGAAKSSPGAEDVGRLFPTKTIALTRARARIRQIITAAPPRGGERASTLATSQRRTP